MKKIHYDKPLLFFVLALCWVGLIAVFSSSTEIAKSIYDNPYHFFYRQIIFFVIGMFLLFLFIRIPIETLQNFAKVFVLFVIVLLILTLIIGTEINGAKRWLRFTFINLQASVLAQFALIIYTADFLYRKHDDLQELKKFAALFVVLGVTALLIALEPDFSTAALLILLIFVLIIVSPMPAKHILILISASILAAIAIFLLEPYRMKRLLAWITGPNEQSLSTNYQSLQSLLSFSEGGFLGVGLGHSKQKFFFLPEAHTDYILAIIGEEMGLIGTLIVIVLFALVVWRGLKIANKCTDLFQSYLAVGITAYIGIYAMINIMVVTALLPSTGLPLPFVSYGGSQLIIMLISVGILLNISARVNTEINSSGLDDLEITK